VIGLTLVLTQRLIRTRSFQAWPDSTTSRGADGFVLHSGSYSTQNSTQPIGARVASPTEMNSGRSCPRSCPRSCAELVFSVAIRVAATKIATALRRRIVFVRERI